MYRLELWFRKKDEAVAKELLGTRRALPPRARRSTLSTVAFALPSPPPPHPPDPPPCARRTDERTARQGEHPVQMGVPAALSARDRWRVRRWRPLAMLVALNERIY